MNSRALAEFWKLFKALPVSYNTRPSWHSTVFQPTPRIPVCAFFKPLHGYPGYWSVRVTLNYRAVCRRDGDTVYWFWIGSHADFDHEFS